MHCSVSISPQEAGGLEVDEGVLAISGYCNDGNPAN